MSCAISAMVSVCSRTAAAEEPANSMMRSGEGLRFMWSALLTALTALVSMNSQRENSMPIWMAVMVVRTAASMLGNEQMAAVTASGKGYRRRVISVMTPRVPSEPTNRRVRS